jgi:phosphatidylethanolamine/phosphatidyl-N-methylethanolamine N-methyltransferase
VHREVVMSSLRKSFCDLRIFAAELLRDPLMVGAILPSGGEVADLMTGQIDPSNVPVIEFGPGTGVITERLLKRGVAEADLVLIERCSVFAELLKQRFPKARIVHGDARLYGSLLPKFGSKTGAVISSLPLRWFTRETVLKMITATFQQALDDFPFYQYSYLPVAPLPRKCLRSLGLKSELVGVALRNVPPAFVFRISRLDPKVQCGGDSS